MWKFLQQAFGEKIKYFLRGAIPAGLAGGTFLFGSSLGRGDVIFATFLKLFSAVVFSFAGGLATVIAHDTWKYWLKPLWLRFRKRIKNRKIKRNDNRRTNRAA